jgi:hypothetical protein
MQEGGGLRPLDSRRAIARIRVTGVPPASSALRGTEFGAAQR